LKLKWRLNKFSGYRSIFSPALGGHFLRYPSLFFNLTRTRVKEFIEVFGRDSERSETEGLFWGPALEPEILEKSPLVIFGCKNYKKLGNRNNALSISLIRNRLNLGTSEVYEVLVPEFKPQEFKYLIVPTKDFKGIWVGLENIQAAFEGYPSLKPFLDSGILSE